jgi:bla regulator protein blaR1
MKRLFVLTIFACFSVIPIKAQDIKTDPLVVINDRISNVNLKTINPQSIESMNVIKGQSAKEAYGVLGENGVIMIYTKDYSNKGSQEGKVPEPLIFVDGKLYTSSLDSIKPNDIESISIKKNKSATSLYGKAGENGIIMVETRKKMSGTKTE